MIDLLVEFWQDVFEAKPLEKYRQEDGEIQFTDTGDDLIDKWEEQLARGEMPDLMEAFESEEGKQALRKLRDRTNGKSRAPMSFGDVAKHVQKAQEQEGYDPRYDAVAPQPGQRGPHTKRRTFGE